MKPTNVADGRGCWLSVLPELFFTYHRSFTAPRASSQTTRPRNKVRRWRSCLYLHWILVVVNAAGDLSDEAGDPHMGLPKLRDVRGNCSSQLLFIYFLSQCAVCDYIKQLFNQTLLIWSFPCTFRMSSSRYSAQLPPFFLPSPVIFPRGKGTAVHEIDMSTTPLLRYIDSQPTVDCTWCVPGAYLAPQWLSIILTFTRAMSRCSLCARTDLACAPKHDKGSDGLIWIHQSL